jgi:hypothetical protein
MSIARKFAAVVTSFVVAAVASLALASAYVGLTIDCEANSIDPCDGGPLISIGLAIILTPILGSVFSYFALRSIRRLPEPVDEA